MNRKLLWSPPPRDSSVIHAPLTGTLSLTSTNPNPGDVLFPLHFDAQGNRLNNAEGSGSYRWFVSANPTTDPSGTEVSEADRYTISAGNAGQHIRVQASFPSRRTGVIASPWTPIGSTGSGSSLSATVTLSSNAPRINDTLTATITGIAQDQVQLLWFSGARQLGIGPSYTVQAADHGLPLRVIAVSSAYSGFVSIQTSNAVQQNEAQQLSMGSIRVENNSNLGEIVNIRIGDVLEVIPIPNPPPQALGALRVRWISGTEVVHSAQDSTTFTVRQEDMGRALMVHVWFDATDQRFPLSAQAGFVGDGGTLAPMGGTVALSSTGDRDNPKVGDILSATLNNSSVPSSVQIVWSWEHDSPQAIRGGSSTYTVQHGDLGMRLRAVPHAVGFNNYGVSALTVNAVTRHDLAGNIVIDNVTRPNETPRVNDVLRVRYIPDTNANSASNGSGERFIRWSSGGTAVSGRDDDESYLLGLADFNQTISVRLWFSDQNESSAKTLSVGPVEEQTPFLPLGGTASLSNSGVDGQPRIGDTLTATLSGQHPSAAGIPVVWTWTRVTTRGDVRIVRASGSNAFIVRADDVNARIRAVPHVAGYDATGIDAVSAVIGRYNLAGSIVLDNTTRPNETPRVRDTLAVRYVPDANAAHRGNGSGAVSIRWTSGGTAISTADNSYSYIVQDADVGRAIGVTLSFADQASEVITTSATVTGDVPHLLMLGGTVSLASDSGNPNNPRIGHTLTATLTGQHQDAIGLPIVWEWRQETIRSNTPTATGPALRAIDSAHYRIQPSDENFKIRAIPHVVGFSNTNVVSSATTNAVLPNPLSGSVIISNITTRTDNIAGGINNIPINGIASNRQTPRVGEVLYAEYVPGTGYFNGAGTGTWRWEGIPPSGPPVPLGNHPVLVVTQDHWNRGLRIVANVSFPQQATGTTEVSSREVRMPPVWVNHVGGSAATQGNVRRVFHVGGDIFLVGTENGRIIRSIDGGQNWVAIPAGTGNGTSRFGSDPVMDFARGRDGVIIAVGGNGATSSRMARSTDDGATWTAITNHTMGNINIHGIATDGNGIFIAGAGIGSIARSIDNGVTWAVVPTTGTGLASSNIMAVSYVNGVFFIGGDGASGGRIARSSNGGATWTTIAGGTNPVQSGLTTSVRHFVYGNGVIVAMDMSNRMSRSSDGGLTWTTIDHGTSTLPTSGGWVGLVFENGVFIATTASGRMAWSLDAVTWIAINAGTTANAGLSNFTTAQNIQGIAFGNGRFIAGSTGNRLNTAEWPDWP